MSLKKFAGSSKEEQVEIESKTGNYNQAPPNFRQITELEFSQSIFFIYDPIYVEFRQIMPDNYKTCKFILPKTDGQMLPIRLYHMQDGTGFGISHDYWAGKVMFFAFGCEHKFKEISQDECRKRGISHFGRCWHVRECSTCHYVEGVDSSD